METCYQDFDNVELSCKAEELHGGGKSTIYYGSLKEIDLDYGTNGEVVGVTMKAGGSPSFTLKKISTKDDQITASAVKSLSDTGVSTWEHSVTLPLYSGDAETDARITEVSLLKDSVVFVVSNDEEVFIYGETHGLRGTGDDDQLGTVITDNKVRTLTLSRAQTKPKLRVELGAGSFNDTIAALEALCD